MPVAYVVARDPAAPPDEDDVKRFFLERGAPYAHPRRVFFLEGCRSAGRASSTARRSSAWRAQQPPLESQR